MNEVIKLKRRKNNSRKVYTAILVEVQIDSNDERNCHILSWENRRGVSGRCPGITTILDSSDLCCRYFQKSDHGSHSLEINDISLLYEPNGDTARWNKSKTIRRCNACISGERILKSGA